MAEAICTDADVVRYLAQWRVASKHWRAHTSSEPMYRMLLCFASGRAPSVLAAALPDHVATGLLRFAGACRQIINAKRVPLSWQSVTRLAAEGWATSFVGHWETRVPTDLRAKIFRDALPDPWQAPVKPDTMLLEWRDGTVTRLAEECLAHLDREGQLEPVRLAILADALEEAGCVDDELLRVLREPAPHWHGFWAVHLLLRPAEVDFAASMTAIEKRVHGK